MRPHTPEEAAAVVDLVEDWQSVFLTVLGRRVAFAADEYYLLAGRPFPSPDAYEGFPMHEDGVGMARVFELELTGETDDPVGVQPGFFAWVDGAPPEGYRAPRTTPSTCGDATASATATAAATPGSVTLRPRPNAPVAVLTGDYGARVLGPLLAGREGVRVVPVENRFFGGNIGVTGLLVGEDVARTLADQPEGHRYLLPDVCLSNGLFLDGTSPADLPRPVEIVATDGVSLRRALEPARR